MATRSNIPTPHIDAKNNEIAETILLPGDPLRAKFIADHFLKNVKQFNRTRNMFGFTGTWNGKRVSVMGTGMGCPSIGIYSYELIHFYGVKNLIRVGSAGAMNAKVKVGDIVLAEGACTTSNFPALMELPGVFAPVGSFKLLKEAAEQAEKSGLKCHVGNVLSSDMFYGPSEGPAAAKKWSDMGVLAVEMETAALYTNASYGKADALAILTISNSDFSKKSMSAAERETSFTDMMKLALSLV